MIFHGIINSTTFLLELNSDAFANRLVWNSCKHGATGKAQTPMQRKPLWLQALLRASPTLVDQREQGS